MAKRVSQGGNKSVERKSLRRGIKKKKEWYMESTKKHSFQDLFDKKNPC